MSQPIKIERTVNRSYYGYSIPTTNTNKYLFELSLNLKDDTHMVRKIDENRFTTLFNNDSNIKYDNIIGYSVNITIIPDHLEQVFQCNGNLNNKMPFYSQQANNIYIEFNKLANGNATCTCRYVDYNNLSLSCSPPF